MIEILIVIISDSIVDRISTGGGGGGGGGSGDCNSSIKNPKLGLVSNSYLASADCSNG